MEPVPAEQDETRQFKPEADEDAFVRQFFPPDAKSSDTVENAVHPASENHKTPTQAQSAQGLKTPVGSKGPQAAQDSADLARRPSAGNSAIKKSPLSTPREEDQFVNELLADGTADSGGR